MPLNDLIKEIRGATWTNDELTQIIQAAVSARESLGREIKHSLRPGVTVSYVSSRNNQKQLGTVERLGIKNTVVRTHVGLVRVPNNMISIED